MSETVPTFTEVTSKQPVRIQSKMQKRPEQRNKLQVFGALRKGSRKIFTETLAFELSCEG